MKHQFRIGIVGSRRRDSESDRRIVYGIVRTNIEEDRELIVVSGACHRGADDFARQAVEFFQEQIGEEYVRLIEFPVRKWSGMSRWEFTQQAYYRNRLIAENSEVGYALVTPDRTGGTENTVGHYIDMNKKVFLVDAEGKRYLSSEYERKDDVPRNPEEG